MNNIQFQSGRNRQAIYSGLCECGTVLMFTPGGSVHCLQCGRRWLTDIVSVVDKVETNPKTRRSKAGPSERKSKAIE